jgi:uncharacterized protein (DUF885 family)
MTGKNILILLFTIAVATAACTSATDDEISGSVPDTGSVAQIAAARPPMSPLRRDDFDAFMNDISEELLLRIPEDVTDLGFSELLGQKDDQLNDLTLAFREETTAIAVNALARLNTVEAASLDGDTAVSVAVLRWYLEDIVSLARFPQHDYAVNYITGAHTNFPEFMADIHPITGADDANSYIARLKASGAQMQQVAENLLRSESQGIFPTIGGVQVAAWQIGNVLGTPNEHPLVTGLVERLTDLGTMTGAEIATYEERAESAVKAHVLPGYEELLEAVNGIKGRSESTPGVGELPSGDDYYTAILRHHVSLDLTPDEIHQIGLENVRRLTAELTAELTDIGIDVGQTGLAGAVGQAYAGAGFFPLANDADRAYVLQVANTEIENAEAAVSSMFTTYPASDLVIVRPRPGRESGAGAYYRPPPASGSRPGIYYLSLGGSSFGKQTFRTTNYHEAIPGHHLQIALQRESTNLPLLQRAATFTGFAEGWGLYAERLAFEAGLYDDDPYGNLGRLQMEMLRAVRVVVDTGIHRLGWSKDEAISYMVDRGFGESWAGNEVERYIVWPGQAPSYMLGMLEILRLRDMAEEALGEDFDLAAFHNEVLRHGSLPLGVLDDVIAAFIDTRSDQTP